MDEDEQRLKRGKELVEGPKLVEEEDANSSSCDGEIDTTLVEEQNRLLAIYVEAAGK